MNRWKTVVVSVAVCALLVSGFSFIREAMAQGAPEPGSPGDPLVTQSWVTKHVNDLTALNVVEVSAGQRLLAGAGAELILRAGQATVIDSELGGLADVTEGEDLRQGVSVPSNHLLIAPRGDGRGMAATTNIIVLVRGTYQVQ